ncbi:MAG: creatininase family protein [Candidatus Geothermarchaeales archaeon]
MVEKDWWYSKNNIFEMNSDEIAEWLTKTDIVLVPIGSCEQHGPHLPISTDSLAAWITTKWAAEKAGVLHTPLVWTGYSPHHMRPPGRGAGTITLRASTFLEFLYDIGRSLIHHGFNKIVYVTGHTSNIKVIEPALRRLRYDTGALAVLFRADAEFIPLVKEIREEVIENPPEENPGWHGSEVETSLVLMYNPEEVKWDEAKKAITHAPNWLPKDKFTKKDGNPYVAFKGQESMIMIPMEHHEYSDTGIIGNPTRAKVEKAEKIYEIVANKFADFLGELKKIKVEIKNREFVDRI